MGSGAISKSDEARLWPGPEERAVTVATVLRHIYPSQGTATGQSGKVGEKAAALHQLL